MAIEGTMSELDANAVWQWLGDAIPDALLLIGPRGRIRYANPHAHTLFGYEPGNLTGRLIDDLVPPEARERHSAHRQRYADRPELRGMGDRFMALFGLRADGSQFPAEIRLAPLQASDRVLTTAIVRDVSAHQKIEAELAAARDLANRANDGKSRFLGAVSHDLRQPLQTLRILAATLHRQVTDEERRQSLLQIDQSLNTMSDLVNAVLDVGKLESGTVEPLLECIAVSTIFDDLRTALDPAAESKGLRLEIPATDLSIQTDRILLRQLLQNLVANAIRYTDTGWVTMRAALTRPGTVMISVSDTGIGIPESALGTIFEDFVQAPRPGDRMRGGVGLGLGTVRRIAALLDLKVEVRSAVGAGSEFSVEIPAAERNDAAARPQASIPKSTHQQSSQTILLVDDNEAVRKSATLFLELDGYRVLATASLEELDQLIATLTPAPSIVISDYQLGNNNFGTTAIDRVRQRYGASVPAIILTGDTSAIAKDIRSRPATALLNKPIDVAALSVLMIEMIESSTHGRAPGVTAANGVL